jgi:hypothetical protein
MNESVNNFKGENNLILFLCSLINNAYNIVTIWSRVTG